MLYHLAPAVRSGSSLVSLNQLRAIDPTAYETQAAKYGSRPKLRERMIPRLNVGWNDAIHFSPVSPNQIAKALVDSGFPWKPRTWLTLSAGVLDPRNTVVYFFPDKPSPDMGIDPTYVRELSEVNLNELQVLPNTTREYYRESKDAGRQPLLFFGIPHVLTIAELPWPLFGEVVS